MESESKRARVSLTEARTLLTLLGRDVWRKTVIDHMDAHTVLALYQVDQSAYRWILNDQLLWKELLIRDFPFYAGLYGNNLTPGYFNHSEMHNQVALPAWAPTWYSAYWWIVGIETLCTKFFMMQLPYVYDSYMPFTRGTFTAFKAPYNLFLKYRDELHIPRIQSGDLLYTKVLDWINEEDRSLRIRTNRKELFLTDPPTGYRDVISHMRYQEGAFVRHDEIISKVMQLDFSYIDAEYRSTSRVVFDMLSSTPPKQLHQHIEFKDMTPQEFSEYLGYAFLFNPGVDENALFSNHSDDEFAWFTAYYHFYEYRDVKLFNTLMQVLYANLFYYSKISPNFSFNTLYDFDYLNNTFLSVTRYMVTQMPEPYGKRDPRFKPSRWLGNNICQVCNGAKVAFCVGNDSGLQVCSEECRNKIYG